jgi:hypothetical protein
MQTSQNGDPVPIPIATSCLKSLFTCQQHVRHSCHALQCACSRLLPSTVLLSAHSYDHRSSFTASAVPCCRRRGDGAFSLSRLTRESASLYAKWGRTIPLRSVCMPPHSRASTPQSGLPCQWARTGTHRGMPLQAGRSKAGHYAACDALAELLEWRRRRAPTTTRAITAGTGRPSPLECMSELLGAPYSPERELLRRHVRARSGRKYHRHAQGV